MEWESGRKWVRVWLWVVGVVGIVLLSGGGRVLADGAFGKNIALIQQDIRGPEQKAVILYRDGKETLILSVKYEGAAGDFAWVVPIPSRPKVEKGDAKVFEELAMLTAPEVRWPLGMRPKGALGPGAGAEVEVLERRQVGVYDVAILAASDETALADWLNKNGYALPGNPEPVLKHYVEKGWFYVAMRIDPKRVEEALVNALRQVDGRIISVGRAQAVAVELAAEDIVVGRTYNGSRLKPIVDALAGGTEEGTVAYPGVPPPPPSYWRVGEAYEQAVKQYREKKGERTVGSSNLAEGTVWRDLRNSIARMFYEAQTEVEKSLREGTLHPLSLSFEGEKPVYPLRMTSLNPDRTRILLYVIAERKAEAEGFTVRYAEGLVVRGPDSALGKLMQASWRRGRGGGVRGRSGEPFLTKLEGEFAPEQMKDDLTIGYARWNRAYKEVISAKKLVSPVVPPGRAIIPDAVALPLLGFLVGVLITLVVTRRRSGKQAK